MFLYLKNGMFRQKKNHSYRTIMSKKLPDLHKQAFMFKNSKRFQHDGGRAWIKD